MTTKLWISDKLELRYSPTGWPEKPGRYFTHYTVNGQTAETGQRAAEIYTEALAKTKAESILVDDLRIKMVVMKDAKRDTFVEYPGELEVVDQFSDGHTWFDITKLNADNLVVIGGKRRKVARLKPVNSAITEVMKNIPPGKLDQHYKGEPRENAAHGYSEGSELAEEAKLLASFTEGPDANDKDVASITFSPGVITEGYRFSIVFSAGKLRVSVPHGSQYHIKNISSEPIDIMDSNGEPTPLSPGDTKIFGEDLQQQLAAANKRIKELEDIFEGEWCKSSEYKPIMNVAVEVFIPEEDNHVTVGMWDVSKKWVLLDEYRTPQSEVTYWRKLRPEPKDKSFNPTEDYDERRMKARILEAFCREYDGESMAYAMLIKVLDELNIK